MLRRVEIVLLSCVIVATLLAVVSYAMLIGIPQPGPLGPP